LLFKNKQEKKPEFQMKIKFNAGFFIKFFLFIAAVAGIFFISRWSYHKYREFKEPLLPAINAIPENTAFFLEVKNYSELWDELNEDGSLWKTLGEIPAFNKFHSQIVEIDSIVRENEEINPLLKTTTLFIAITAVNDNEFSTIFIADLSNKKQSNDISRFIENYKKNEYHISNISKQHIPLYELYNSNNSKKFYYSLYKGVFIAGLNKNEVFASAVRLDNKAPITKNEAFSKLYSSAGKNVKANLYLNFSFLQNIAENLFQEDKILHSALKNIKQGWMAMDINIKEKSFLINGFINSTDTNHNILNIFKNDEPQKIHVTKIIPDNASMFLIFGFKDFYQSAKKMVSLADIENSGQTLYKINNDYDIEVEKYFNYWVGKEISMFQTLNPSDNNQIYHYLAVNTIDKKTTAERMLELTGKINPQKKINENLYKGYDIQQLEINNLLENFFGLSAFFISRNYYTIMSDYIVFSNSPDALMHLIDKFILKQTIENNTVYNNFAENFSDKTSLYLYFNYAYFLNQLKYIVQPVYKNSLEKNNKTFGNFQSFGLQLIPEKELYYMTVCFDYKRAYLKKPAIAQWQVELDTIAASKPIVVKNISSKKNDILIADASNQLYLIDNAGQILWKRKLKEKLISHIYQIDFYDNGKLQYLFNTENYIYLIDRNSKDVDTYPVKLKSKATNGMLVVYYPDIKDYRIYLACENKKVYCMNKEAISVEGWQFKHSENLIIKPIQYFSISKTEYLVFTDTKGRLYITDRRGNEKFKMNKNLKLSLNNRIFETKGNTNHEHYLVFTKETGEINMLHLPDGAIKNIKIRDFSSGHYFLHTDINNDKSKDYVFIDQTTLEIYNSSLKLIYSQQLKNPLITEPLLINDSEKIMKFGIINETDEQLTVYSYLHNSVFIHEQIQGNSYWVSSSLQNNHQTNIIIVKNRFLTNYTN